MVIYEVNCDMKYSKVDIRSEFNKFAFSMDGFIIRRKWDA